MDKSVLGHAGLAVAASLAAYVAWSAPSLAEKDAGVVMVPGESIALQKIEWNDESGTVLLERDGPEVQVTVSKPAPATPQVYPGTQAAKDLFEKLAPLRAARSLGETAVDKQKGFGLDAPKSKLVLHFKDGGQESSKVVEVGSATFGSGDFYARGPDHITYLLRSSTLSSLGHGAMALQDREAVGLSRDKFDRVQVTFADKHREFSQRHGDDLAKAFFSDPADPDHKLEIGSTWIDRVLRLRVTELAANVPTSAPALTVEFFKDKESQGVLNIWPTSERGSLAKSTHFKTPFFMYKGSVESVLHDVDTVLNEGH